MNKIKPPSVAGVFYTNNTIELNKQIEDFKKTVKTTINIKRAVLLFRMPGLFIPANWHMTASVRWKII